MNLEKEGWCRKSAKAWIFWTILISFYSSSRLWLNFCHVQLKWYWRTTLKDNTKRFFNLVSTTCQIQTQTRTMAWLTLNKGISFQMKVSINRIIIINWIIWSTRSRSHSYPNNSIQFCHRHLFSSLHSCRNLLLML